jgi:hypothetical protein
MDTVWGRVWLEGIGPGTARAGVEGSLVGGGKEGTKLSSRDACTDV